MATLINQRDGISPLATDAVLLRHANAATAAASDATWNATSLNYGVTPAVNGNLGANPTIATSNTAITSGALYNFLGATNAGSDASTLKTTSTFGNTTNSMIRFAGAAYFAAGNYDFQVRADDGFSIRIDGVTVFEFDNIQSPTTRNTPTPIAIGEGLHTIEILYWEQAGNAELQVGYKLSSSATYTSLGLDNIALFQSSQLPTLSNLQDVVESSTNAQYQIRTGTDYTGTAKNDSITGSAGRDNIDGGAGKDTINGGGGSDWLEGGAGDDNLTGGAGSDTFRWQLSDKGAAGTPAADVVTDFSALAVKSGGDALDLRDLLQGENHASGAGNLAQYLHFEQVGDDTLVHISSAGSLTANGANAATVQDQTIWLNGVTLATLGGTLGITDSQIIQNLLANGKLIVD